MPSAAAVSLCMVPSPRTAGATRSRRLVKAVAASPVQKPETSIPARLSAIATRSSPAVSCALPQVSMVPGLPQT